MKRKLLVVLFLISFIPLAMGHVNHQHGSTPAPVHPDVAYSSVALVSLLILVAVGAWIYKARHLLEKDTSDSESATEHQGGWSRWFERNFHRLYVLFLGVVAIGSIADGHDHTYGGLHEIVTFGHVVAPLGMILILVSFSLLIYLRYKRGISVKEAIPDGYFLSALALPLFFIGFGLDQLWHMIFGLEQDGIEVMSPTHLWVLFNGALIAAGPLRRGWYLGAKRNWKKQIATLTSAGFLFWILSYMMWALYPYGHVWPSGFYRLSSETLGPTVGVAGIMVFSMITMFLILHLVNRFDIVPGGLTYMYSLGAIGMIAVTGRFYFIPAILLTGFAADILNQILRPKIDRLRYFRLYAFLVPVIFAITYYLTVLQFGEIIYVVHVWGGSIVFAGFGGVFMSYAIQPFKKSWMSD